MLTNEEVRPRDGKKFGSDNWLKILLTFRVPQKFTHKLLRGAAGLNILVSINLHRQGVKGKTYSYLQVEWIHANENLTFGGYGS